LLTADCPVGVQRKWRKRRRLVERALTGVALLTVIGLVASALLSNASGVSCASDPEAVRVQGVGAVAEATSASQAVYK
jgi:hypothetical protein